MVDAIFADELRIAARVAHIDADRSRGQLVAEPAGTMTQRVVKETSHGDVLAATLKLPAGKVRLRVHDHESMRLDLRSCTARQVGKGTWRIVSGTGAYRGASGSGTFVRRALIVGAFDDSARCLGESAPPAAQAGTIVTDGTASR